MKINRNTLGHLDEPQFVLYKASGERVGVLNCTAKKWEHKYNDLDTISFELPYKTDGKITNYYNDIDIMKYVEVPEINAVFAIKDIGTSNEGQDAELKTITAQSRECELGQKYLVDFTINYGTTSSIDDVVLYAPGDQAHSLLHLAVLEKCPSWSFDYVSPSLRGMKRSFEISRQDIYSFLINNVSQAFECIFVFNSRARTINVYAESEYGLDTNIHVSFNNLLKDASLSYSIDEIKTCVTLEGEDDLTVREINMGFDALYDFSFWASTEYWSQSLLDAYNAWMALIDSTVDTSLFRYKTGVITQSELQGKSYKDAFTYLLAKYQDYYTRISEWQSTMMPYGINTRKNPGYGTISYTEDGSDAITLERQTSTQLVNSRPSSGSDNTLYIIKGSTDYDMWRYKEGRWVHVNHWYNCCLDELKILQAAAEKQQSVAMKAGYGDSDPNGDHYNKYVDTYLPAYYMYSALQKQIENVSYTVSRLTDEQSYYIQYDKNVITNKTAMRNNFTVAQLKELSSFIREEHLSSDNYLVTDVMTEDERFEMLYSFLEFGQKELAKVAQPQLQFSVDMLNLFAIPEFDQYSADFDLGNYVWVTIRDDYSVKAKILSVSLDFLDQSQFSVTFGNVMRKARNIFTDVTDALNAATSAATSVSFGASYWSAAAEETDSIGKALSEGLLSQSYYLSNAEDNEILMDDNGLWITTTTGEHGRETTDDFDSIYLGGGRILFTSDGWRSVSMSVGRGDVTLPQVNQSTGNITMVTESKFGTFADFLIAGYVGGSIICGGDIYSENYQTSSSVSSGNKGAHIDLKNGTFEFNSTSTSGTSKKRLVLSGDTLTMYGTIQASSGHIGCDDNGSGGFVIDSSKLYNNKSTKITSAQGIYLGTDGIGLGYTTTYTEDGSSVTKSMFQVDINGNLYAASANIKGSITADSGKIGGFTITSNSLYKDKSDPDVSGSGVYIGTSTIALGNNFKVTRSGTLTAKSGYIGGVHINGTGGLNADNGNWYINSDGTASFTNVYIDGVSAGSYFGGVSYDSDGDTMYNSNYGYPFVGNCRNHIESLAVGQITADNINAAHASIEELNYQGSRVNWTTINYVTGVSINGSNQRTAYVATQPQGTAYVKDTSGNTVHVPTDVGTTSITYYSDLTISYTRHRTTVLGDASTSGGSDSVTIITTS